MFDAYQRVRPLPILTERACNQERRLRVADVRRDGEHLRVGQIARVEGDPGWIASLGRTAERRVAKDRVDLRWCGAKSHEAAGGGLDESSGAGVYRCGFVARIVEPIAPNFAALRRVSSDGDRP